MELLLEPDPAEDYVLHEAWESANSLIHSWLVMSVAPELRQSLLYFTNACDVWNELKIRYGRSDGPRIFFLEKTLSSWDEYMSYKIFPQCTCGVMKNCKCNLSQLFLQDKQSDCAMKFLVGLNESYAHVRNQLLLCSPVPNLSKIYSLLLQEEGQRLLQPNSSETMAC